MSASVAERRGHSHGPRAFISPSTRPLQASFLTSHTARLPLLTPLLPPDMAWATACQPGDRLQLCVSPLNKRHRCHTGQGRAGPSSRAGVLVPSFKWKNRSLEDIGHLVFVAFFLRPDAVGVQGSVQSAGLYLFRKVGAAAPASQNRSLRSFQFIIILRACICASDACCFVFHISFGIEFSARCFHKETVSHYCQFPYFCPFAVRDGASGFSMRNREKLNKYRTIPPYCARTGIGSVAGQPKLDI